MVSIIVVVFLSWRTGWRQWSGPPPGGSVVLGGNSNRLVSSAVIYYLSISQCGRKRRVRRGRWSDGEVSQMEGCRRWEQESEEPQQHLENN